MSFSNGTPASLTALMNDLKTFAIAYGGLTDTGSGYSASGYTYFSLTSAGGNKINFAYKDGAGGGDIMMNTSTAWAGSGLIEAQTGAFGKNARAYVGLTPIEYWFFTDGYSVHAVVEFRAGAYAHISFGMLEKYGTYTGGEYVSANYWNQATWSSINNARTLDGYGVNSSVSYMNHVRVGWAGNNVAAFGNNAQSGAGQVRNLWMSGGAYGADMSDGELLNHQPNSYNGRSVLIPPEIFLAYDLASQTNPTGWIPVGRIGNAAWIDMMNLNAEDTVNTDWMVFPLCMKNAAGPVLANGEVNTLNLGLAYKK